MPQVKIFLVRFFATISCIFAHHKPTEEDLKRKQVRLSRKAELDNQKTENYNMRERILNYTPHTLPEDLQTPEQISQEHEWVEKAVSRYHKVVRVNSIDGYVRMYEVEVKSPHFHTKHHSRAFKTYVYAYVECRNIDGALVFIYTPTGDDYKAIAFYGADTLILGTYDTIELARRIFAPLFNEDEVA